MSKSFVAFMVVGYKTFDTISSFISFQPLFAKIRYNITCP